MPTAAPSATPAERAAELDAQAKEIIEGNDRGGYTVPTAGLYPYQWNWDSAFAALGFATFDLERAWTELETLFAGQWANGMAPHILFHRVDDGYFPGPDVWRTNRSTPTSSGISQPAVAGSLARLIFERDPELGRAPMARLFPKLVAWHRWWMTHRCESGAIATTHPWESGRDNALDWDAALKAVDVSDVGPYARRDTSHVDPSMRPTNAEYDRYVALVYAGRENDWDEAAIAANGQFRLADPTLTFTLLRAHRDLAIVGARLGLDVAELEAWTASLEAGAERLWNEERAHYDAYDLRAKRHAQSLSNASFLCFWAGLPSPRMRTHLVDVLENAAFGVPSSDPTGPLFDPKRYWRGPVWGMMNLMISVGLAEAGEAELAARIREDTRRLITEHGFAEYYDAMTGAPAGGAAFTWTAAVWLAFASPNAWMAVP